MALDVTDSLMLADRLRRGEQDAFAQVVDAWSPGMLRLARSHVSTDASAEEVVQDAWLAVVRGIDGFEGRSSLRTWVFQIVANVAKTRGVRERVTLPWSALDLGGDDGWAEVDPSRLRGPHERHPFHWTAAGRPAEFTPTPEDALLAGETRQLVARALDELPERQRLVVSLRDVHGWTSEEVCDTLGVSAANQRVLLHRGRTAIRASLEEYYRDRAQVKT